MEQKIKKEDLIESYLDIQNDIAEREGFLDKNLSIETVGLGDLLENVAAQWRTGKKSLRAFPVLSILNSEQEMDEDVGNTLVGLDAVINCLDDVIDTENLTDEEKIFYTANIAFSMPQIMTGGKELEDGYQIFTEYWTDIFQIPAVEGKLNKEIEEANSEEQVVQAALKSYNYRSRDIDIFTRVGYELTQPKYSKEKLINDLRTYRARELLVKDIKDIERDKEDNDLTPVIKILDNQYRNSLIEEIHGRITYDTEEDYKDTLKSIEPDIKEALKNSDYFQIQEKEI